MSVVLGSYAGEATTIKGFDWPSRCRSLLFSIWSLNLQLCDQHKRLQAHPGAWLLRRNTPTIQASCQQLACSAKHLGTRLYSSVLTGLEWTS